MRNKFIIGTVLTGMLLISSPVEAMGNAKVIFTSNDNIQVGDTFTVSMSITDINDTYDGVVSMGGNLSFDSNIVEYVSSKGTETPYLFQINEDYDYKLAGLDFTLDNGIRETLTVYEFTFKALKKGNTTITLSNAKLTDSQDYINTVVLGKEIIIEEKEEIKIPETPKDNKAETVAKKEITKKAIETKIDKIEEKVETSSKEDVLEKIQEKEISVEKVQNIVNELVLKLRNLFK